MYLCTKFEKMIKTIYIGSDFDELRVRPKGFTFSRAPYVVLFNKQKRMYYEADLLQPNGTAYDVTWTSEVTSEMIPGIYALEVYADDSKTKLLKYQEVYAQAITVAASPEQENGIQG